MSDDAKTELIYPTCAVSKAHLTLLEIFAAESGCEAEGAPLRRQATLPFRVNIIYKEGQVNCALEVIKKARRYISTKVA